MGEVTVETNKGDITFEIKGDVPTPYEETRIMKKVRELNFGQTELSPSYSKSGFEPDTNQIDTQSGIKDASLRAALSIAEKDEEQEKILRNLYGMSELDYFRDNRGRLGLTPEGARKVGVDIQKNTLIDESGFSRYDFADMAGIAPEVALGIAGGLKGAALGSPGGPGGVLLGGALGAGTGAAGGQALEETVEAALGVQDQTAAEVAKDLGKEFTIGFLTDATLGGFGLAFRGLGGATRAGKGLTPDELEIAAKSIDMGINPTLSAIRAPSIVARQQGIVEKIFGTSQRLKQNNDIMQKKIAEFRDKFPGASDEEVGQLLMSGTGKSAQEALKAEQQAQIAVLKTLRGLSEDLGAAAQKNENMREDVFQILIDAKNEFDSQMKILFQPIDDLLESTVGSKDFIPLGAISDRTQAMKNYYKTSLASRSVPDVYDIIKGVEALGKSADDKTSFLQLYNLRKDINDRMSKIRTGSTEYDAIKEVRDAIDQKLTTSNLEDIINNSTDPNIANLGSRERSLIAKATSRLNEARGKYKEGATIFEDIESAGIIKDLANKARTGRIGVSDVDISKIVKNGEPEVLRRALNAVSFGQRLDPKKVGESQFRKDLAAQWLNNALETSGISKINDFDPTKFKGAAFAKAIDDLGQTADVLFGAEAKAIKSLAQKIGKTNVSNLDKQFVKSVIDDAGADATLKTKLQLLSDAQDALARERASKVLRDLQTGDMNQIQAAEAIADGRTNATDIEKIMNAFAGQPEAIAKIQGNYMERLISDFGDTLTTDGKQLGAFAKRLLDADKGGKLSAIFGEEMGKDIAEFARILDFNSRTAAGGDLVAANIAASPIQNLGKLLRYGLISRVLMSGPYYKQIVSDYKAISQGLDPREKAQTLGRLIAGALTRAAAQGTAQETQEGVREVENQITSVMDSSGLSDQISKLQQQMPIPNNSSGLAQAQPVAAPVPTQVPQPAGLATLRQEAARNPGIARTLGIEGATAGLLNR